MHVINIQNQFSIYFDFTEKMMKNLNPGLWSRFPEKDHIEFPDYTLPELREMFELRMQSKNSPCRERT